MTQQYSQFMRWTSRMVILSMLTMGLPLQSAFAGIVETDQAVSHELAGQDRTRINAFIDREDVLAQLQKQGVTAGEAKARVNAPENWIICLPAAMSSASSSYWSSFSSFCW